MSKQPTDFVGITSLSLSLTHVYSQPLVGICIYRWLSMAIDCFLYILSCVFIIEIELHPRGPIVHLPISSSQIEWSHGGGRARDILMPAFHNGHYWNCNCSLRCVVACWIIVSFEWWRHNHGDGINIFLCVCNCYLWEIALQPDDVSDTMTSNRRVVGRMVHPRVVVQVHQMRVVCVWELL